MSKKPVELPTTIDGAARLMLGLVPEDDQAKIAYMSENDLPELHMGLGQWVRNPLGLWGSNTALDDHWTAKVNSVTLLQQDSA